MLKELANLSYQMLQLHGHVIDVGRCRAEAGAERCLPPAQARRHAQTDRPMARPHQGDHGAELVALAMIWGSACLLLLVSASALFTPFEI